ncbi:hypothetical protein [Alkalihalobacillus sp. TS-13]|nr:hypothetical protein [Alkalihalobacillus sp. TS-13]
MTEKTINKTELIGAGLGIIFMAFFGMLWSVTGNIGLQGLGLLSFQLL